ACNLGEALRRIYEGAALIRTKGEAGTGNIIEATRHIRMIVQEIASLGKMSGAELSKKADEYRVPPDLVEMVARAGKLPVPNFAAGGVATPADAAFIRQLGAEAVFVGSGIFKSENPAQVAKAIVEATTHFDQPKILLEVSRGLGGAMKGIEMSSLSQEQRLSERGW
ncbi:MAG: pyridoxal 5'-phosphate synthase lyase subunit PdxS, partial [Bdellovibrionales bacterium]|nr:pyridoxal 5'-phosphate synthase lyase subunit PdxS [Bdellovibrionales bacterium]